MGGWTTFVRDTRGVAMTEFAIIMPMLFALIFGIVEFGHFVAYSNAVETAAREGARYGSAVGIGPNGALQYLDCLGIRDAARAKINLVTINNPDVSVTYDEGPGTGSESYNCNSGPFQQSPMWRTADGSSCPSLFPTIRFWTISHWSANS